MRFKSIGLLTVAVACGLTASIGVSQYMESAIREGGAVETAEIIVAVTDVDIGEELCADNVKLEEWPKDRIPMGAITDLEEIEARFARARLYAGEPVLEAKLMDSNSSKAITILEGYRVVSVRVSMHSSVSGLVQPGDRVDLLVFVRMSNDVPMTGTKTILRDVNVFAVDSKTERNIDPDGQARTLRTVSLMVKPEQAEAVMLASELGQLALSLRRPDDTIHVAVEGQTVHSLLGIHSESANPKVDHQVEDAGAERKNSATQTLELRGTHSRLRRTSG